MVIQLRTISTDDERGELTEEDLRLGAFVLAPAVDIQPAVDRAYQAAAAFFDRPEAQKRPFSARRADTLQGWTLATDTGPSTVQRPRDYESWDVVLPEGLAPLQEPDPFFAPTTVWPDEKLRDAIVGLRDLLVPVRDHADRLLLASAGLPGDTFSSLRAGHALSSVRILQFQTADHWTGLYAHEDSELITLLFETEPGIHVWDRANAVWHAATRPPDTVLVLVGEAAALVSGGRLHACRHRVQVEAGRPVRQSVAWFCAPGSAGVLEDPRTGSRQTGVTYMLRQLGR